MVRTNRRHVLLCHDQLTGPVSAEQRFEKLRREVPNHRHADAVSADVVCVVVAGRKPIVVAQPHEPRGLSWRQQSGANFFALDHQNRLARGAASRRPKAARDFVEANFGALALCPIFIGARASVARRNFSQHRPTARSGPVSRDFTARMTAERSRVMRVSPERPTFEWLSSSPTDSRGFGTPLDPPVSYYARSSDNVGSAVLNLQFNIIDLVRLRSEAAMERLQYFDVRE